MKPEIKIAITGIGNCLSSLIQGIFYYKNVKDERELVPGLMHNLVGGYKISDIKPVAAFDIDVRKVGKDLSEAIVALPNCTKTFCKDIPKMGVKVKMGRKNGASFRWSGSAYEKLSRKSNFCRSKRKTG